MRCLLDYLCFAVVVIIIILKVIIFKVTTVITIIVLNISFKIIDFSHLFILMLLFSYSQINFHYQYHYIFKHLFHQKCINSITLSSNFLLILSIFVFLLLLLLSIFIWLHSPIQLFHSRLVGFQGDLPIENSHF